MSVLSANLVCGRVIDRNHKVPRWDHHHRESYTSLLLLGSVGFLVDSLLP